APDQGGLEPEPDGATSDRLGAHRSGARDGRDSLVVNTRTARARDRETHRSLENNGRMLTVFLFDEQKSERVEDWRAALERLTEHELLWLAMRDPTEEEVAALQDGLELDDENAHRLLEQPSRASLADAGERLHVTLYAASVEGADPVLVPLECVLGPSWVVTAHSEAVE